MTRNAQKSRWHAFSLAEQEKRARWQAEALMKTLRRVLNITFDASCECDETGHILCSSPQLQHLLNSNSCDLVDCNLVQLAANPAEAQRVDTFLKQMLAQKQGLVSHAGSTLALLETVLRSCSRLGNEDSNLQVKLCCVALPMDCTAIGASTFDVDGSQTQRLFVGLQEVINTIPLRSTSHIVVDRPAELGGIESDLEVPMDGGCMDLADTNVDSVTCGDDGDQHHEKHSAEFPVILSGNQQDPGVMSDMAPSMDNIAEESEVSFALTSSTRTRSRAAVGTLSDAGVQTELMQSAEVAVQAGVALPPIPRARVQQQRRAMITLRTHKVVMREFQETPAKTLNQLLSRLLLRINPRGRGCCYLHVGLAVLQQCISTMTVWQCSTNSKPRADWQCQECFALNLDELEIEGRKCSSCFAVPPVTEHVVDDGESPSCEADASRTDSDSLAGADSRSRRRSRSHSHSGSQTASCFGTMADSRPGSSTDYAPVAKAQAEPAVEHRHASPAKGKPGQPRQPQSVKDGQVQPVQTRQARSANSVFATCLLENGSSSKAKPSQPKVQAVASAEPQAAKQQPSIAAKPSKAWSSIVAGTTTAPIAPLQDCPAKAKPASPSSGQTQAMAMRAGMVLKVVKASPMQAHTAPAKGKSTQGQALQLPAKAKSPHPAVASTGWPKQDLETQSSQQGPAVSVNGGTVPVAALQPSESGPGLQADESPTAAATSPPPPTGSPATDL